MTGRDESDELLAELVARVEAAGVEHDLELRIRGGRVEAIVDGMSIEAMLRLNGHFEAADAVAAHESVGDWDGYVEAIVGALA